MGIVNKFKPQGSLLVAFALVSILALVFFHQGIPNSGENRLPPLAGGFDFNPADITPDVKPQYTTYVYPTTAVEQATHAAVAGASDAGDSRQ